MENRAGFQRDVAILVESVTSHPVADRPMIMDNNAVELAKDYRQSMLEVWYAIAHCAVERMD
jgi:hypothetical protein